jgi:D-beta-D-heptose 7-phosphate kinase/D-beta-D-heptose 1-phosphate adenosyltransferase
MEKWASPRDLACFDRRRVLVVGDVMIDEYVWGDVTRISPEAPVPVVSVEEESTTLGGAGNVVANLVALGAAVSVTGVVGEGNEGQKLIRMFQDQGVDAGGVLRDPGRITTRKTRVIAGSQHVVRIDRESSRPVTPAQAKDICSFVLDRVRDAEAVLLSDYGKGVVTPALAAKVVEICRKADRPVLVDPKGRDYSKYKGAFAITPNRKEASEAAGILLSREDALHQAGARLLTETQAGHVLITCGRDGMVLFTKNQTPERIPARARQVYDVSGAGDTVLAVLGLCVACGAPFADAARLANTAAGIVVGKVGTATVSRGEIEEALAGFPDPAAVKQKDLEELSRIAGELKRSGKKVVLTNGCFDLLHAGHVQLFAKSRQLGDVLVVAVDDDAGVRKLKGAPRPVLKEKERVRIISSLDSVDYVHVFPAGGLERLIRAIRPDVLAKGSNYRLEEVEGRELVEKLGGRVELAPVTEGLSSSGIIHAIRDGASKKNQSFAATREEE